MYIYLDIVDGFACEMCGTCCRNEWSVTVDEPSYQRNAALFARTGRNEEFQQAFVPLQGEKGFVNFIFKKTFYIYGLERGQQLLQNIWRDIDKIRRATIDSVTDVEHTRTAIMAAEFQYSHNRRQLWNRYLK